MATGIIAAIAAWIVGVISAAGYIGIVALMAIESACIPLPSEIIMTFAGYLVSTGRFDLVLAATAGAIGCNVGSVLAYEAGRHGGRPLIARYGRFVLLSEHDLRRAEDFFARFGNWAVLIGRLLPGIRSFIAFPAGIARMPLGRFHLYTFIGSWPWCFGLAYLGKVLGSRWHSDPRIAAVFHKLDLVFVVVIVAAVGWFAWHRLRKGSA